VPGTHCTIVLLGDCLGCSTACDILEEIRPAPSSSTLSYVQQYLGPGKWRESEAPDDLREESNELRSASRNSNDPNVRLLKAFPIWITVEVNLGKVNHNSLNSQSNPITGEAK
jgi:hypothetical protein